MSVNDQADQQGASGTPPAEASVDLDGALSAALSETFDQTSTDTAATPPVPVVGKSEAGEIDWTKVDFDKAPQDVREKLYAKFQPNLQKRVDELAKAQTDLYERTLRAWESKNAAPPPPDLQAKLKEAIENNDLAAVAELSTAPLRDEISAIKGELTRKQALEQALASEPTISQNQDAIADQMKSNPAVLEMASIAGNKYAPFVLRGLNAVVERDQIRAKLKTLETNFKAAVEQAVKQDRIARTATAIKLGTSSSSAGTSASPLREGSDAKNIDSAMGEAWEEVMASRS